MVSFQGLSALLTLVQIVSAGYNSGSFKNIAVYWGQNSMNVGTPGIAQGRLSLYCASELTLACIQIIPVAFLVSLKNPEINLANQQDGCATITGSKLLYCKDVEADIVTCQKTYGKTILLSIGGATYTEGGFDSAAAATAGAQNIWKIFGPYNSGVPRPFGTSAVDGFDFDYEATVNNMIPFGVELRRLMDADKASTGKNWLLTVAPQCEFPDRANGAMLDGQVFFDIVMIQFYNNWCGVQNFNNPNAWNYPVWHNWAKTASKNPNVKLMIGVPGGPGAAGSGYVDAATLAPIIQYGKGYDTFTGIMMWDASRVWQNPGFLDAAASNLGLPAPTTTLTTITTAGPTPTPTGGTGGTIPQWGQVS
ncbi:glycoside hydrolase superfamily [Bisporella sp. PMI_857]|nr:glycoside hydrolase superfamily [Bisporella sp. PMI_857]